MTADQQHAAELWAALNIGGLDGETPNDATVARVASAYRTAINAAERKGYARGRAELAAKVRDLAAAQEASSARWTEAISEADNPTDAGYFSGRAHAAEQAAIRLRALIADDTARTTDSRGDAE